MKTITWDGTQSTLNSISPLTEGKYVNIEEFTGKLVINKLNSNLVFTIGDTIIIEDGFITKKV